MTATTKTVGSPKITPAMKKWCHNIFLGRSITRLEKNSRGPYETQSMSSLNHPMAKKMEDMGLIEWHPREAPFVGGPVQLEAVLTDIGYRVINKEPPVKNPYPAGYMQQRGAA